MRLDGLADPRLMDEAASSVRAAMRAGADPNDVTAVVDTELLAARRRFGVDVETATRAALRELATGSPTVRGRTGFGGAAVVNAAEVSTAIGLTFRLQSAHREAIRLRTLQLADRGDSPGDVVAQVRSEADGAAESAAMAVRDYCDDVVAQELLTLRRPPRSTRR